MRLCGTKALVPILRGPVLLTAVLTLAACDDPFEALRQPVPEVPGEATLVDFREGPLREPSAFDLIFGTPVRVDQTSGWDFLFAITEEGTAALLPVEAAVGTRSEAGLLPVERSFEELRRVPASGYVRDAPVPVAEGDVLAAVSRPEPGQPFVCRHFGKLEILDVEIPERTVTFRFLVNPNCEIRDIIPGEPGEPE